MTRPPGSRRALPSRTPDRIEVYEVRVENRDVDERVGPRAIVVVGSANVDFVVDVDRRPLGGETVLGSDLRRNPGGKGANQAVAAGRLGGDVAFIGCVGDDDAGDLLRRSLAKAGVDVSMLHTVATPTGTALILLTPDGENSIVVSPGANRRLTPDLVDQTSTQWLGAAIVVVQLEIPLPTVHHLARRAAAAGSRVVVNAAPAAELPRELLELADPLVVNEHEAAFLLGGSRGTAASEPGPSRHEAPADLPADPFAAASALLLLGPRSVVLTSGAQGSVLAERLGDPPQHVAAHRVTAVDTTGAGDAFVGALATTLADGAALIEAVRQATAVAAVAVSRPGAQESYPTREELRR